MSTLTSSSTYAEIVASYKDNASWYEDGSVAKAKAFVTACEFLLLDMPDTMTAAGSVGFGRNEFERRLNAAKAFVSANRSGGRVRYLSFRNGGHR